MLNALGAHLVVLGLAFVQAGEPVLPERVEPAAAPTTPAARPVMPTDGRADETRPTGPRVQQAREPIPPATAPPLRMRKAPSIFTDEAYRHNRVRSLLLRAYDRRR